jgi:cytochrome c-type biogenesis protein CcmH/NrfG
MLNFWIAIVLSSLFSGFVIYVFALSELKKIQIHNANNETKKHLFYGLFIGLFLLLPILFYAMNPSQTQQKNLENLNIHFKKSLYSASTNQITLYTLLSGLRTVLLYTPDNAKLWFILAERYFQSNQIALANAAMKRAITLEPSHPDWYVAYAQLLALSSTASDLNRAIAYLEHAIQLESTHQSAMLTLGFFYLKKQRPSDAINIWKKLEQNIQQNSGNSTIIRTQINRVKNKFQVQ